MKVYCVTVKLARAVQCWYYIDNLGISLSFEFKYGVMWEAATGHTRLCVPIP